MDVTCERCSTAYEFDDALVSERGTTVKCTNCGHQFKVRRAAAAGAPERWLVRTIDGRELEFRALRELQGAIAKLTITRDDVLIRGAARPRRLGAIAELEPFFNAVSGAVNNPYGTSMGLGPEAARARNATPQGPGVVAPTGAQRTEGSVAIPLPIGPRTAEPEVVDDTQLMPPTLKPRPPIHPGALPPPAILPPPNPPARRSVPPPAPRATTPSVPPGVVVSPDGAPIPRAAAVPAMGGGTIVMSEGGGALPFPFDDAFAPPPPAQAPRVPSVPPPRAAAAPLIENPETEVEPSPPMEHARARESIPPPGATKSVPPMQSPLATPTPAPTRAGTTGEGDYLEPRFSSVVPARRAGPARWIVGFVIGGMLALGAATVGRKMLTPAPAAPTGTADARIATLLQEGEKSLAEGDLEGAKEHFDKASVLAENDARLLGDLARLSVVRADIAWLRTKLLADGDPERAPAARELDQAADRARKATTKAAGVDPNGAAVIRCRIDAARITGDLAGARKLVGELRGGTSDPANALVLAGLDLAEAEPSFPSILDRLRAALSADPRLSHARALLVYALARSGDVTAAKAELDKLGTNDRPHPLAPQLRAYVARQKSAEPAASASASAKAGAKAAPSGAPSAAPNAPPNAPPNTPPRDKPEPHDPPSGPPLELPPGVDVSDLPGIKPPPASPSPQPPPTQQPAPPPAPAPAPAPKPSPPPTPPGVDTSDLPGFK